jgi:hypothetical protein
LFNAEKPSELTATNANNANEIRVWKNRWERYITSSDQQDLNIGATMDGPTAQIWNYKLAIVLKMMTIETFLQQNAQYIMDLMITNEIFNDTVRDSNAELKVSLKKMERTLEFNNKASSIGFKTLSELNAPIDIALRKIHTLAGDMRKIGEDPELLAAFFKMFTDDNFKTIILAEAKLNNDNTKKVTEIVGTQVNSKNFYHIWLLTRITIIDAMQKEAEPYLKMYISQVKRDIKIEMRKTAASTKALSGAGTTNGEQQGQRPPDFGCWSCGNTDKKHNRRASNRNRQKLSDAQKTAGAAAKKAWETASAPTKTPTEAGADTNK